MAAALYSYPFTATLDQLSPRLVTEDQEWQELFEGSTFCTYTFSGILILVDYTLKTVLYVLGRVRTIFYPHSQVKQTASSSHRWGILHRARCFGCHTSESHAHWDLLRFPKVLKNPTTKISSKEFGHRTLDITKYQNYQDPIVSVHLNLGCN